MRRIKATIRTFLFVVSIARARAAHILKLIWLGNSVPSLFILLLFSLFVSSHVYFTPSVKADDNPTTTYWWPMFGHDLGNTRFSPSPAPHTPRLQWEFRVPAMESSPAVVNGRVFIGSDSESDKGIYCLNETDGALFWSYGTNGIVTSSPAVFRGRVFIGSEDGNVYCLNATNGALIWNYPTDARIHYSSPAVADDMVFIGSDDDKVYALNEFTGDFVWSYTTGGVVRSSPAVADGIVFVGSYDNKVYALNESTGALIWSYTTGGEVYRSSPAVVNGRVFIGSDDGLYCLNETDGTQIWKSLSGGTGDSSPAVANGRVFITMYIGGVYCLNETTGASIWNYTELSTLHSFFSSPTIADGLVFINAPYYEGPMAFDETTGVRVWKYLTFPPDVPHPPSWGETHSSPAVANGKIFMGSTRVFCFGPPHLLTIKPTFSDNTGSPLNPHPSSWSILFPNDTVRTISLPSVTYPQAPPGKYSIVNITWQGTNVVPKTPPSIFLASDTVWTLNIRCTVYSLTIDPIFYDNTGTALVQPSWWSIRFPNGITRTFSSSVTYNQAQAGDYSIVSIIWKGVEVVPDTIPTTSLTSDMLWSPSINCLLPTSITISLSSSTSYVGFKVEINGNLTCNEVGLLGTPILLSYSVTGGESWNDITLVNTASDGSYSAVWMPSATGNYLVRATWFGNSIYPGTTTIINLAVTPFKEQNVFSVTSNSTISELAFNSRSRELSFTVTGPTGTTGYVNVYIAKTLIDNIADVKVYLDGDQINYTITSTDDSWLLHFTYRHSTHTIAISLGLAPFIPPQLITPLNLAILAVALAVAAVILIFKIHKGTPPTILNGVFRKTKQAQNRYDNRHKESKNEVSKTSFQNRILK